MVINCAIFIYLTNTKLNYVHSFLQFFLQSFCYKDDRLSSCSNFPERTKPEELNMDEPVKTEKKI